MFRRAQAALEFLTTYGWAFLVILIMIGALAYFGILSPSRILPDRCNFGAEFQCLDYQISATANTFRMRLKNNVGEPVTISAIALKSESGTSYACSVPPANPAAWKSGDISNFLWSGCNSAASGIIDGEKGKVLVTISYYSVTSGANYTREVNGEVFSTVV